MHRAVGKKTSTDKRPLSRSIHNLNRRNGNGSNIDSRSKGKDSKKHTHTNSRRSDAVLNTTRIINNQNHMINGMDENDQDVITAIANGSFKPQNREKAVQAIFLETRDFLKKKGIIMHSNKMPLGVSPRSDLQAFVASDDPDPDPTPPPPPHDVAIHRCPYCHQFPCDVNTYMYQLALYRLLVVNPDLERNMQRKRLYEFFNTLKRRENIIVELCVQSLIKCWISLQ